MSVPISVVVETPEVLREKLSGVELWELFDDEALKEEELESDELDFQQGLLDCYETFRDQLTDPTRSAFEQLVNVLFWSWRDAEGVPTMDVETESDELDSSYSPSSCQTLLSHLEAIDREEMKKAFQPDEGLSTFEEFIAYFDQWKAILTKAREEKKTVFVFVLG
ncbi:MAG: hypothetical protein AAF514_03745 [Verrucomicrobiota bacterium]